MVHASQLPAPLARYIPLPADLSQRSTRERCVFLTTASFRHHKYIPKLPRDAHLYYKYRSVIQWYAAK